MVFAGNFPAHMESFKPKYLSMGQVRSYGRRRHEQQHGAGERRHEASCSARRHAWPARNIMAAIIEKQLCTSCKYALRGAGSHRQ